MKTFDCLLHGDLQLFHSRFRLVIFEEKFPSKLKAQKLKKKHWDCYEPSNNIIWYKSWKYNVIQILNFSSRILQRNMELLNWKRRCKKHLDFVKFWAFFLYLQLKKPGFVMYKYIHFRYFLLIFHKIGHIDISHINYVIFLF